MTRKEHVELSIEVLEDAKKRLKDQASYEWQIVKKCLKEERYEDLKYHNERYLDWKTDAEHLQTAIIVLMTNQ